MKLQAIVNEKNHLEFKLTGERHTLPNLLRSRLAKDADVTFVAYKLKHPLSDEALFIVKTKSKDAKKVVLDACKTITDDLDEFGDKMKKALK